MDPDLRDRIEWQTITPILIDGIIETRRLGIKVLVRKTGKAAWIPRRRAQFYPGKVFIPHKIAKEILK